MYTDILLLQFGSICYLCLGNSNQRESALAAKSAQNPVEQIIWRCPFSRANSIAGRSVHPDRSAEYLSSFDAAYRSVQLIVQW